MNKTKITMNSVVTETQGGNNFEIGNKTQEETPEIQKALAQKTSIFNKMSDDDLFTFVIF